jgi:CsoR family transcriptional regulator, copper-sensing transcriptional repressor
MQKTANQRAIHRIRILKGLLHKLEVAIQDGTYCPDLLNRSLAIQRALKSLDALLLETHLDSCVKSHMKNDKRSTELRKELLNLYKLSRKDT